MTLPPGPPEAAAAAGRAADSLAPVGPDPAFDRFARLVSAQLGVPASLVSVLTEDEQLLPGALGLPAPYQQARRTPLSLSLCREVVRTDATVRYTDVRTTPELAAMRLTEELGVVSYAGAPVRDLDGQPVGALCAIDHQARELSDRDVQVLEDLAAACSSELALRQARQRADQATAEQVRAQGQQRAADGRFRLLLMLTEGLADVRTVEDVVTAVSSLAREHLGTDHAGIALHDPQRARLHYRTVDTFSPEATAWWADVRVDDTTPVGTVTRTGRAEYYPDHAAMLQAYPHLAGVPVVEGIGARAALPLVVGGRSHGALFLTWPDAAGPDEPDEQTRLLISGLARYTAQAVVAVQLLVARGHTAEVLQRAMLTDLPQPDHLQLHSRYLPAADTEQVGGDWYDAVVMPDGATTLVIGDVVGHDIDAAAQMGQLRSITRATAWAFEEPASKLLTRVDHAISGLRMTTMATALLARIEQDPADAARGLRHLRWSSAGHPPPLLITADGDASYLPGHSDLLLGVNPAADRHDHLAELPPSCTLLLFTDGLVERRDRPLPQGLDVLRTTAATHAHADLELTALVGAILDDLVHNDPTARDPRTSDDIAVLAIRAHPEDRPRPPEAGPGHL